MKRCQRYQWDGQFPWQSNPGKCKTCRCTFAQHPGRDRIFLVLNYHRDDAEFEKQLTELLLKHSVNALPINRDEVGKLDQEWADAPLRRPKKD